MRYDDAPATPRSIRHAGILCWLAEHVQPVYEPEAKRDP